MKTSDVALAQPKDVPAWLWLGLPLGILILPFAAKNLAPSFYQRWVYGELGVIENLTVLMLAIAIIFGVKAFRRVRAVLPGWLKYWVLLIVFGCFYFAGEELSWGQHYFKWSTPGYWKELNTQGEFNLHNTSALLDQVPRFLLTAAALVGGVLVPLFLRGRWTPRDNQYWLWPTLVCLPSALLATLINLPQKLLEASDIALPVFLNIIEGESKECLLAAFLMMYLVSLALRAAHYSGEASERPVYDCQRHGHIGHTGQSRTPEMSWGTLRRQHRARGRKKRTEAPTELA